MERNLEIYNTNQAVDAFDTEEFRPKEREIFERYFKGKILDLGCGTGRTTKLLSRMGFQVEGIDYAAAMIDRAQKRYPDLTFKVMDASDLKYPDESFNTVFFSFDGLDMLYPESARLRSIKEAFRVLKKGGIFAYSSRKGVKFPKNRAGIIRIIRSALKGHIYPYQYGFQDYGALLSYRADPPKQIRQLKDAGFEFVELIETENNKSPFYIAKKYDLL